MRCLSIDDDIAPCVASGQSKPTNILSVIQSKIDELTIQAKKLGKKEQELEEKAKKIKEKELVLNNKEKSLKSQKEQHDKSLYSFYCEVLGSGHCKKEYVKVMEQKFWEEYLEKAIAAGATIGKDEHEVKQEISYAMVSIYQDLELYDKAYDFLVEQATGYAWLNLSTVQSIVKKVGYCDRLKTALYIRLAKGDLSPQNQKEFEEIKNWLVYEYRQ